MKLTIFYSWQSRTETKYNKNFIKDCIESACKKLEKGDRPNLKGITFLVQEGVTREPGSPPVADTILKRISDSDLFIADLSVTDSPDKIESFLYKIFRKRRQVHQANNVVEEHGYALSILGNAKIIGVLNRAYGSPNLNPDNIYFDIDHLRHPIEYTWNKKNEKERSSIKKQLVDDLVVAISDCALEALKTIKNRYLPFKTWSDHQKEQASNNKFFENETIITFKKAILDNNANIRILGLSGLGKTRIITECYRSDADNITKLYLYCDYHPTIEEKIMGALDKIFRTEPNLHLVIDNCPLDFHRRILTQKYSIGATNPLLTVYNKPEEEYYDSDKNTRYLKLSPNDLISIVEDILSESFGSLGKNQIEIIKDFSAGIPLMAVLLGESVRNGEQYLGRLDDKVLLNKILSVDETSSVRKILQSISLFDHLGYEGEYRGEIEFVAKNKNITPLSEQDDVIISQFDEVFHQFHKREIFEKNGRLIRMRPVPLAISLAVEWFDRCSDETLLKVIDSIQDEKNPYGKSLVNSFAERIKYLGFHDKAKGTLEKLIGPDSPFDNAKVVDTELGSRLFRSFVEVNPEAVTNNLARNFGTMNVTQLKDVVEGRRNLVWVLEKACFNKSTFFTATKVLMSFAVAENETWGNNATGQFLHLFNIHLAGTEADLNHRLDIIRWALNQSDEYTALIFKAMDVALNCSHFHRMGGAEKQGTKILSDYSPTSEEISAYWHTILDILVREVGKNSYYSDLAGEIIINHAAGLLRIGVPGLILPVLLKVAELKRYEWDALLDVLYRMRSEMQKHLHPNDFKQIQKLIALLSKDTFLFKYKAFGNPNYYEGFEHDWRKRIEVQQIRYKQLAEEFVNNKNYSDDNFKVLYENNHIMSNPFGKRIAELLEDDFSEAQRFIDQSIKILSKTDVNERNPLVILNFAQGLQTERLKHYLIDSLIYNQELSTLIFPIYGFWAVPFTEIELLFSLVSEEKVKVSDFMQFFNNYSIAVNPENTATTCMQLLNYGVEGKKVAIKILYNHLFFNKNEAPAVLDALKKIISSLSREEIFEIGVDDCFESIKLILDNQNDYTFATQIIRVIIVLMGENRYSISQNYVIEEALKILFTKYFEVIWPDLSHALLSDGEDYMTFYNLHEILKTIIMSNEAPNTIISKKNIDEIFDWCRANPNIAPTRFAYILPLYQNEEFHPLIIRLLDVFGNQKSVLDALSAGIHSFSWVGSVIPLLKSRQKALGVLLNHKHKEVILWAEHNIHYFEEEIKREKQKEAEEKFLYN